MRKGWLYFSMVVIALSLGLSPARAALTYHLHATSRGVTGDTVSDFDIVYIDNDIDAKFNPASGNTLVSFTGVTINGTVYPIVFASPPASVQSPFTDGTGIGFLTDYWGFQVGSSTRAEPYFGWNYTQVAPIPTSALLLGTGIIWLARARRKERLGQ
jgi:hypothetical protein